MGFLEAVQKHRSEALILLIGLFLFGCVQPPTIPQNGTNVTVLREPTNPIETLALCTASPELRYACNVDSDCTCNEVGLFIGNKIYYNYCADKTAQGEDFCGGFRNPTIACVEKVCTNAFPRANWTFENCDNLTTEETRIVCKRELSIWIAQTAENEDFCNSMNAEASFNRTNCGDIFYRGKAYQTENATWCEKISDAYERGRCNP